MREATITFATLLFAATLFMLLGRLGAIIVERLGSTHHWLIAFVLIILLVLLSAYCGARININRFSLHGVYRNRLARAFIGTARPPAERKPDAYTRFDPGDNLRMQDLYQGKEQRGILFPVVNVTLNLLEGAPSAWAERKAAPFTITPLRSGAACLGGRDTNGNSPGRYVRTTDYGGQEHETGLEDAKSGITLGTAMTISGAAVSPNMGYHSSPATAFVMTLFDVRLGAWLPNPGVIQRWTPAKPSNALFPLFNEMLGRANDTRADIYLSDGGHFDNLGVYEMLRRRCRIIVAIDAGCDPDYRVLGSGRGIAARGHRFRHQGPVHRADHQGQARSRRRRCLCQDQLSGRPGRPPAVSQTLATAGPAGGHPGVFLNPCGFPPPDDGQPVFQRKPVRELSGAWRTDCGQRIQRRRRRWPTWSQAQNARAATQGAVSAPGINRGTPRSFRNCQGADRASEADGGVGCDFSAGGRRGAWPRTAAPRSSTGATR